MSVRMPSIIGRVVDSPNPNVDFQLSYCTLTKRGGTDSYYSVTAPFTTQLADALTETALIYLISDGTTLDYFNVDSFEYFIGPNSSSVNISGYRQEAAGLPFLYLIQPKDVLAKRTDSEGRLSLDLVPFSYPGLKPGNLVNYETVTKALEFYTLVLQPKGPTFNIVLEL